MADLCPWFLHGNLYILGIYWVHDECVLDIQGGPLIPQLIVYANKVILDGLMGLLRMGAGYARKMPERPTMWLEFWDSELSDIILTSGEGRQANLSLSHVASDSISHAYLMIPQ